MANKQKILKGRLAVDAYRDSHIHLYDGGWHKGISEAHTPLLNTMLADLKKQGFNSLDEFFATSEQANIEELGFASREDFDKEIDRLEKIPDKAKTDELRKSLEEKWK